eukprot:c21485_g1_i4.p1 GENE.c21485_g1_i4~~c21485_g1_i4.p1  ORF type:complete len:582 (+),score=156.24 c21485_g1_i4:154-1899(+)
MQVDKESWIASLPDAPVFHPSTEEFKDPIAYIQKISITAKSTGICKIVPPAGWNPKFALDLETVKFPTRIQNIANLQKKKMMNKNMPKNCRHNNKKNVEMIVCEVCEGGFHEEVMLLCDKCGKGNHIYCLTPPLTSVPKGNWICLNCRQKNNEIGFEVGKIFPYPTFEKIGNYFKKCYFEGKDLKKVTINDVEKHFWRIVEHREREVEVLYGNDLDTSTYGSGFSDSDSPWNLNNIARVPGSLLSEMKEDILGIIVPWLYFGMIFSSFCWHNEDHYMYSIAYHHFGSPKTWYGVPGNCATEFENAMKAIMPTVFETYPDLLYQLAVMISPRYLIQKGVPIYRAHQMPGEFIVTFPAAYHAGFSHGVNCTEAVNFATADWLQYGFESVKRYRLFHREPVFSHEELILKCSSPQGRKCISTELFKELLSELKRTRDTEVDSRKKILSKGTPLICYYKENDKSNMFHNQHCKICNSQLYLSALTCDCSPTKLVCLDHAAQLCACSTDARCLHLYLTCEELDERVNEASSFLSRSIQNLVTNTIPETPPRKKMKFQIKKEEDDEGGDRDRYLTQMNQLRFIGEMV